jgi:hypothetical protein
MPRISFLRVSDVYKNKHCHHALLTGSGAIQFKSDQSHRRAQLVGLHI